VAPSEEGSDTGESKVARKGKGNKGKGKGKGKGNGKSTKQPSPTLYHTGRPMFQQRVRPTAEVIGPDNPTTALLQALERQHAELKAAGQAAGMADLASRHKKKQAFKTSTAMHQGNKKKAATHTDFSPPVNPPPRTGLLSAQAVYGVGGAGLLPRGASSSPGKVALERKKRRQAARPRGPYHQANLRSATKGPVAVPK
jgi:hypothetical protein